jgi:hypothetical protein
MKLSPSLCLLPVALVAGFFAGRQGENEQRVEKKRSCFPQKKNG